MALSPDENAREVEGTLGERTIRVRVAGDFMSRLVGLLCTVNDAVSLPLLLTPCRCVHSFGMRRQFDVVFLDRGNAIVRIVRLQPGRIAYCPAASQVLELSAGLADQAGLKVGQRVVMYQSRGTRLSRGARRMRGSSVVELLLTAPILLLFGLGIVQMGFVYHAQVIVNHATFEAARVGAVEHALPEPMRRELGRRLAPHEGGDGSATGAAQALVESRLRVVDAETTRLRLVNPTREAFDDWAVHEDDAGGLAIPNAHLKHRDTQERGARSGMNLQDANLLEIEVVHGYELDVPLANRLFVGALALVDPEHTEFYDRGLIPLRSTSRVRMQSEAWEHSLSASVPADAASGGQTDEVSIPPGAVVPEDCMNNHGLGAVSGLLDEAELTIADCLDIAAVPATANGSSVSVPPPANTVDCATL